MTSSAQTQNVQAFSEAHPQCEEQKEGNEDAPGPGDQLHDVPSSSGSAMHADEDEEAVITCIRVRNVALGLGRIPAGFYAAVQHSGLEWRTENKRLSLDNDVVEWGEPIPIPSNLSATVSLGIYASFEFQPMLGNGEQLRKLTVTVDQLLNCSATESLSTFSPDDDDVVSRCSSLSVTVARRKRKSSDSAVSRVLEPHCSTTESRGQLEIATTQGHSNLSRYRKYRDKRDLESSILQFERALDICPPDHPCRAAAQSNMAMAKFIHYQLDDTLFSLDIPFSLYRNALSTRPVGHPDRPSTLIHLAAVHFTRFEKWQDEVDAAQAEALLHEVMDLNSAESYEHRVATSVLQLRAAPRIGPVQAGGQSSVERDSTSALTSEGPGTLSVQLLRRFGRFSDFADTQQTTAVFDAIIWSTSFWDCEYLARITNLNAASLYRLRDVGELIYLNKEISRYRDVVDSTPNDHPNKPGYLNSLGNTFRTCFERDGELNELHQAISRHKNAVDLTPDGHPNKPGYLNNLGLSFKTRFQRLGQLSDLGQAILRHRDAVDLAPDSHPDKSLYLSNLGDTMITRFECFGDLSDLEQGISRHRDSVHLTPDGHPNKPRYLNNLGISFKARFKRLGELDDLEEAISRHRDAVDLTPDGHPNKPNYLTNLGNSFRSRFDCLGDLSDLEQAISRHGDAVDLAFDRHPGKPSYLSNFGNSFLTIFQHLGKLHDLEQAIARYRDAVDLTCGGHPDRPAHLINLGNSLLTRFSHLGELDDLEQGLSRHRDAVDLTPHRHPARPSRLGNLGNSLLIRFERLGELSDLEQAISRHSDAVDLTPYGHPDKPHYLHNLAKAFLARFQRLGKLSDLEQVISRQADAVNLTPDSHPEGAFHLSTLGTAFVARFHSLGELSDLEQAIARHRDAVNLTHGVHPDRPTHLSNLGNSLHTRFKHLGELSDIEQAISCHRDAVDLTPGGHPERPTRLSNLAITLRDRFLRLRELSDLEQAIVRHMDAVDLAPDGHPDRPGYLSNLGLIFLTRFEHLGQLGDLEQAISRFGNAVDLTPDSHPDKSLYLSNLGIAILTRFERLGEPSDLEQAISRHRDAVDLIPDGHPDKPCHLSNLGNDFRARFQHLREAGDLEQAISIYLDVACASTGPIIPRFHASQQWISCARVLGHHSLLRPYSVAIGLLPQLAWIGFSLTRRYRELIQGADVVREAAAAALDSGLPKTAVEWLEQGRSIVWGELFQLRSSYDELSAVHPDHARRLRQLSAALEHASTTREKSLSSLPPQSQGTQRRTTESLDQQAERHRALAIERDKLLQEIRGLPGFERFLLHKEFSQLRASAHSGPIVILNAAESRCDALIVLADVEDVIHVPLPNFTLKRSEGLQNALKNLLGHARAMPREDREGDRDRRRGVNWESVLSVLWNGVVKPVLHALNFLTPGDLSRIFWCPTGPFAFLPIHAAGLYGTRSSEPGHKVSDFVVSSYVPTLSILVSSPKHDAARSGNLCLLTVRQPPSDGQSPLPGVDTELEYIKAAIQNPPLARTTLMESSVGTVEEVLALMKESDWVHFACHGIQDATDPTDSGLCLANQRRLKLTDIVALSRSYGGLAFLSACQTAMGDEDLSDEAIHIAAGMLFAGYGGVVGTMWSIKDRLAPLVTKDVYEQLFGNGATPDYREAARALHNAVGRVRDSGASFDEWLPFIHVGL